MFTLFSFIVPVAPLDFSAGIKSLDAGVAGQILLRNTNTERDDRTDCESTCVRCFTMEEDVDVQRLRCLENIVLAPLSYTTKL